MCVSECLPWSASVLESFIQPAASRKREREENARGGDCGGVCWAVVFEHRVWVFHGFFEERRAVYLKTPNSRRALVLLLAAGCLLVVVVVVAWVVVRDMASLQLFFLSF